MSPSSSTARRQSGSRISASEAEGIEVYESLPARLAWFGALLLLFLAPEFLSGFWPVTYDYWPQAVFLLGTAALTVLLAISGLAASRLVLVDKLVVGFGAWCLLSMTTTTYVHDSLLEIGRLVGLVAVYLVLRCLLSNGSGARNAGVLCALTGGVALVAVQVILNYLQNHDPRQFGTFFNPNLLANALAMSLPCAAGLLILARRTGRPGWLMLASLQLLVLLAALCLTSSKGGLLAGGAGLLVCVIGAARGRGKAVFSQLKRLWPVLAAAAALFVFLAFRTVVPRLQTHFQSGDYSTLFRYYTWQGTLRMAKAKPIFGWGPGSFPAVYPRFAETGYTRSAHESWLQLAAESGFPAMLLLASSFVAAMGAGWRRLKERDWPVAAGAMGAIAAFAVHGLTDAGWGITSIGLLCFAALALLVSPPPVAEKVEAPQGGLRFSWLALTIVLAGVGYFSQRAALAEDAHQTAEENIQKGALPMALDEAEQAVATDPLSSRMQNGLAAARVTNGNIQGALEAYQRAYDLQPSRAANSVNLARIHDQKGDLLLTLECFNKAVELDPNDTSIRLERAEWLLAHKNSDGVNDLKFVIEQRDKPYGLYAATPEWVNLDYARATIKLLPYLWQGKQFQLASDLVAKAQGETAHARANQGLQQEMMKELGAASALRPDTDLDELESDLADWKSRLDSALKK